MLQNAILKKYFSKNNVNYKDHETYKNRPAGIKSQLYCNLQ
jgi:hypothetical protein